MVLVPILVALNVSVEPILLRLDLDLFEKFVTPRNFWLIFGGRPAIQRQCYIPCNLRHGDVHTKLARPIL